MRSGKNVKQIKKRLEKTPKKSEGYQKLLEAYVSAKKAHQERRAKKLAPKGDK